MTLPTRPPTDETPPSPESAFVAATLVDEPAPIRGHSVIAWCLIVAVTSLIVVGMQVRSAPEPAHAEADEDSTVDDLMAIGAEVQGKVAITMHKLMGVTEGAPGTAQQQKLYDDLEDSLNQGPPSARLRFVVLAGDLQGPAEALTQLERLRRELAKTDHKFTPDELKIADSLEKLYRGYVQDPGEPPQLEPAAAAALRTQLGWFGQLALAPADGTDPALREQLLGQAARTVVVGAIILLGMLTTACVGFVILMTIIVLAANGTLTSKLIPSTVHPGLYAETFACWMILFTALNVAFLALPLGEGKLWAVLAAQFLSLGLALCWPVFRGVNWSDVRRDVGLTLPRHAWLEPLRGLATYAMSLPILAIGLFVMIMLMQMQALFVEGGDPFSQPSVPTHPIVETVRDDNPWIFWQILLVAAVGAPIVEEIMFRGVLYRSLRDSSRRLRASASILISVAVSGFLFAVIHPQGWLGIPALGALATGFAIAREYRGTIWPSIFAHAFNNSLVTLLLFSIVGR